jgi:hypothetical protein
MIDRVYIEDDWATRGHRVAILGRPYPGQPRHWLDAAGGWHPIQETGTAADADAWWRLPEGALDAIVAAYAKVASPHPATERHLDDAIKVRDRLLALVERTPDAA